MKICCIGAGYVVPLWQETIADGIERVFSQIGAELPETLTVVASKSGGTKETRNGMLEAIAAAEKTINFETYIYWSGDVGREFVAAAPDEVGLFANIRHAPALPHIKTGKVRVIGCSNETSWGLMKSLAVSEREVLDVAELGEADGG